MNQALALAFLAFVSIGGLAWVFIYPMLSGERQAEQRRASFAKAEPTARRAERGQRSRREKVEESLKEVENKHKQKKQPLTTRLAQAGLKWSKEKFFVVSGIMGVAALGGAYFSGMPLLPALVFGLVGGLGFPRWMLNFLKKKREMNFLLGLPDAVDLIVRGIKAGLPLFDSIKIVAREAPEPVRSEFAAIVETQAIGMPLGEACLRMYERMPVAEANFFGIVISIQQASGGNLSEALGNLSKVLRDRKKMKAKIRAMSMEAKASAGIIGSLPPIVMVALSVLNPSYVSLLWTTQTGHLLLAASGLWMGIGVLVMKKMINFDF